MAMISQCRVTGRDFNIGIAQKLDFAKCLTLVDPTEDDDDGLDENRNESPSASRMPSTKEREFNDVPLKSDLIPPLGCQKGAPWIPRLQELRLCSNVVNENLHVNSENWAHHQASLMEVQGVPSICQDSLNLIDSPQLTDISCRGDGCFGTVNVATHLSGSPSLGYSPPYKRIRALRLFDAPAAPKTTLQRSAQQESSCAPWIPRFMEQARGVPGPGNRSTLRQTASSHGDAFGKVSPVSNIPAANVNPFTPTSMFLRNKKRRRESRSQDGSDISFQDSPDNSDCEFELPTKKIALHDSNISRYQKEFHELSLIGRGGFGSVYKCLNRLDGCVYAIKKSLKPVAGSGYEKACLNEVYAHAVLGKHPHVVRYYSAWAENDHILIQNEYCNGGSLADLIEQNRLSNKLIDEMELKRILLHVAEGLRYFNSLQLVHLDINPGNIFISREKRVEMESSYGKCVSDRDEELLDGIGEDIVTYKIGDLGHVTCIDDPQVEDGDCRYLPVEIMQDDYGNLPKADVFALGLTIYEAATGYSLPLNGEEWHSIRSGQLRPLPTIYSKELTVLIKDMTNPKPEYRLTPSHLLQHRFLCPHGNKTKTQLKRELNAEKLKNEILTKKLENAAKCLKTLVPTSDIGSIERRSTRNKRLVGKNSTRSQSASNF